MVAGFAGSGKPASSPSPVDPANLVSSASPADLAESAGPASPASSVTFYVVRHGQTLFNVMSKVQGWCDTPLTSEGVQGAESLGRGFAQVDFKAAYSSDSGRAIQTLDTILSSRLNAQPNSLQPLWREADARLREWCYGDLEGEPGELLHQTLTEGFGRKVPFEELNRRLPEVADVIADADRSGRAERFDAIQQRLLRFFCEAGQAAQEAGGGNVLVVTHAFVVRSLVYLLEPDRVNDPLKILNASVTELHYNGQAFSLGAIGSTDWQR